MSARRRTRAEWVMVPSWWLDAQVDPDGYALPAWQRAAFLAMARMRRDGHAHFATGELASLLGGNEANAARAVREAVRKRWASPGSWVRCVVMPEGFGHGVGIYPKACTQHDTATRSRQKPRDHLSDSDKTIRENPRDPRADSDKSNGQILTSGPAESCGSQGVASLILSQHHHSDTAPDNDEPAPAGRSVA